MKTSNAAVEASANGRGKGYREKNDWFSELPMSPVLSLTATDDVDS